MRRFISVAIIVGVMIFIIPGCGGDKKQPDALLDNARNLIEQQDYHRAAQVYRQVVAADPDAIQAWSGLARARMQLGDTKGAADAYRQIIRIDPENNEALLHLGRFDLLSGSPTQAEEKIRRVLRNSPDNTDALLLLTDVYKQTSRFTQAEAVLKRLLPLVADKTRVLTGLAQIQALTGDLSAALESLEKAVALAPETIEPRLMLFNYYYGKEDYRQAEDVLRQMVAAKPDNPALRILLGKFYFNRGRTDDAESAFLEAVKLDPDQVTAYLITGKFYSAVNRPDDALNMFQKADRLNPGDMKVSTLLAEFYLDNDFLPEARRTIDGILDQHPAYFPARLLKIRSLLAEKKFDQAISLCDSYLTGNPGADQLLVYKGMAHVAKGELDAAERVLNNAVKIAPTNINAKFRLLDVYLRQDKVEQAQALNRDIFGYLHKNFDMAVVLGDTELHKEMRQKGLDSLDSLSRFASTNPFERFRSEHLDKLRAEYDRLMNEFSRLLDKRPELISLFENIILLHAARQEYDIALDKCDRQIERLKDDPTAMAKIYNIKGGLYLAQNNIDQAETAFKQAIMLAPDFLKPYYGLAKIYIINKDIDSAISQYKALLERDPQQPVPFLLMGVLSKMKGDFGAAEDYYRKALSINPDFVQAANNLAYLLADRKENLDEALALALHAKKIKKDDPYILDTLGWVYFQQGAYDDAIRELSRSVEQLPGSAPINFHLGMAYYKKGETVTAKQYLEKALQYDGGFGQAEQARQILRRLY